MTQIRPVPALSRLLDPLAAAAMAVAGVSLVGMVAVQAWQVFARYVLNNSPGWTEPVALVLMSLAVMLGAAVAVRRESHFAFNGLIQSLPGGIQRVVKTLSRLLIMVAGLGIMVLGAQLTTDDWSVQMAGAGLPAGVRFLALMVGGFLIALFAVERLVTGDFQPPAAPLSEPEEA